MQSSFPDRPVLMEIIIYPLDIFIHNNPMSLLQFRPAFACRLFFFLNNAQHLSRYAQFAYFPINLF